MSCDKNGARETAVIQHSASHRAEFFLQMYSINSGAVKHFE